MLAEVERGDTGIAGIADEAVARRYGVALNIYKIQVETFHSLSSLSSP